MWRRAFCIVRAPQFLGQARTRSSQGTHKYANRNRPVETLTLTVSLTVQIGGQRQ
jgi:hypothetical protein